MNPFLIQIPFFPEQASNFAFEIDLFYLFLFALTGFFTLLIGVAAVYFLIKYRRRSQGEVPEQIEGHLQLEITWTVIPFLISMVIFAWGAKLYYQMYTPPTDALEIFVTGKQWMWRAQHPDGQREINELHVPGPPRQADHDQRGRDSRVFHPGVQDQDRRGAGAIYDLLVHSDQDRDVSFILRRVLRHAAFGNDRQGHCHGAP